MRLRLSAVSGAYRLAWRGTRHLPAPVGYGLAHTVADALWAGHRLSAAAPGWTARAQPVPHPASRDVATCSAPGRTGRNALLHALLLRGLRPTRNHTGTDPRARARRRRPPAARGRARGQRRHGSAAHGNWDLIGAWACRELATVLTVAERLEPEDLFEQFVSFRQSLGMRIIGQARGEKVFDRLLETASQGHYVVALLADRDLSSAGITAQLGGAAARVAAGPAAIAQRLGRPLYAASIHYEPLTGERRRRAGSPWGLVLTARRVPEPQQLEGREQVAAHTRAWVAELEPLIAEYAEDWHMLQPVFDADLDQDRLGSQPRPRAAGRPRGGRMRIGIVCPYSFDAHGGVKVHVMDLAR